MNPEPVAMETLHRFRLEAEVYDLRSLTAAIAAAERMPDAPPVHIKLDTGMHRLGFMESELPGLLTALRGQQALKVASILSHMVASEDPAHDGFTREQIASFTRMASAIGEVLGYRPFWHMANSAGIARWPEAHFDMVRLGIGLHGIGADAEETKTLMHTVSLRTPIAQLKQLNNGDTVGADDNSGGGQDALLSQTLSETGVYVVIATPFAPNRTGNYTLSLTRVTSAVAGLGEAELGASVAPARVVSLARAGKGELTHPRFAEFAARAVIER
jgi:hypothetical protein